MKRRRAIRGEWMLSLALVGLLAPAVCVAPGDDVRPGGQTEPTLIIDGPYVTFDGQSDAVVSWRTREPGPSILEYGEAGQEMTAVRDDRPTRSHSVRLEGLRRNAEYTYRIRLDEQLVTEQYTLDTEFDFSIPELPDAGGPSPRYHLDSVYARAAEYILERSGIDRGYCIDYGCADGRLAREIARRSKLYMVGASTDRAAVQRGREKLLAEGVYGSRVTLRHVESLDRLPFPDMCANLIVSGELIAGGRLGGNAREVTRKLRPEGGKAYLGVPRGAGEGVTRKQLQEWLKGSDSDTAPDSGSGVRTRIVKGAAGLWGIMRRPDPLPGAGEWTHAYGSAGQTANSGDELVRGQAGATLEVQWFGLPGPNAMMDRQVRMQGPLSTAGRIFVLGHERVIALDAYNGAILWSMEIPGFRRTNIPRNTGNACASREYLFAAVRDRCWRLDADTGHRGMSYPLADDEADGGYDWGYVATDGARLFGSAVRRGSMEAGFAGPQFWFDKRSGSDTYNVCSDNLFADRIGDGKRLWTYANGLIINATISMGGGRLYFLESRSVEAASSPARKLGPELWDDVRLVAVSARTGKTIWEQPLDIDSQPIVIYLVHHDEQLAVVSSFGGEYDIRVFAARDGSARWQARPKWRSNNHGHHIQHPVIAQGRLFQEPNVYDWQTGAKIDIEFPGRSKCGTITGAANMLHYR
ncbi:MAG: PQQ-binding-like beta-propeller repeat protein, partial [Armatimonadota bacterium]